MIPEVEHKYEARTRLIFDLLLKRKRIFAMIELEENSLERERLFTDWKELTKQIEALNR